MSAVTLLSVIAPVATNVPQGPSGEAASGFRSLLAALSGADAAATETATRAADTGTTEDAGIAPLPAPGLLASPAPPPVPLVLPAVPEPASDEAATSSGSAGDETAPVVTDEGRALVAIPAGIPGEDDQIGARAMPLLPSDKGPAAKSNEPQVQPRIAETEVMPGRTADTAETLAGTAATTEAAEARARVNAIPAPPPSSLLPATPQPAPLRPLAERTSRPVEGSPDKAVDSPRVTESVPPTPTTGTAATPGGAGQPGRPADVIVAAGSGVAANAGDTESPTSDLPPIDEGAAVQTQSPTAARETVVSQLSRATIEATAQIAAQILRRLEGRSTRFEMALTPDELGRVDVRLDIDSEGRLNARLAFDNPAAATDLRGRADELRRQLEDAGFHLADDAFEFAERDSGSSAFDRGHDARNGQSRAFAAASRLNDETDVAQPPGWLALSLSPSGVDMKV